jgi:hypothetical protein
MFEMQMDVAFNDDSSNLVAARRNDNPSSAIAIAVVNSLLYG